MDGYEITPSVITDAMASHAKWQPNKLALICGERNLTWQELNKRINKVANALLERGLQKGDKVALLMTNSSETIEIIFGIIRAGGVAVPLQSLLTGEILATLIDDCDAKLLFVGHPLHGLIGPHRKGLTKLSEGGLYSVGADVAGWSAYSDLLEGASDDEPPVQLGVEDDCNIIYSSGTTGDPKGIVLTHFSRREAAIGLALEFRIDCTARTLVTTPLCSNGSWMMFLPTFLVGGAIVIMPSFDPRDFLRLVQQHRCTHTFIVPTQSITILSVPEFGDYDLSSMRIIVSAGAPLREETKRELLRKFAAGIVELYGLTEGFATFMRPEEMARKIGSVGTPTMGADVAILDDEGNELPPGEVGEIAGYATGRMRGYYKKPEATAAVWWQDRKGRVFIKTGDIGRLDKDGYLYIMDRKKDMIITGGFNVFPKDIEEVIMRHPDVADATVIGVPHEKWGETPLALVIRREGAKTTEDMLAEWINQNVAKHQRVAGVEFRDALPRNLLGKVLKRQLREYYWSRRVG